MIVDLRSDTVTRPTPAMLEAMMTADVGDDVYGEDPAVNALEAEAAARFGKEAAVFTPTGSMANQIGLQLLVRPGEELLCDVKAHVVNFEMGAAAALGGISTRTWAAPGGRIDVGLIEPMINRPNPYVTTTRAIAVENTHNIGGGTVQPIERLRALRELADAYGLALHLDGARIWNAHAATGVPLAEYGRLFDTVSVCLSKGLGAPVGSLLITDAERAERGRVIRKRLGGGMRQVGYLAAAGRYALDHHIERLADDHDRARRLARALEPLGICDASQVETNIVLLRLPGIADLAAAAAEQGVRISVLGPDWGRMLTHLDVDDAGVEHAVKVLGDLIR
ncbi:aminotransferase class I/II-fold pyridoxal phosphate-dependent enzyme [Glycomyces sp. TRM65418]|uniref:threonine aldolase family protein n=1 Tax=Glycomyces sp. TRM65418 TaxID=2867006 RepID=UPI001CE715E3|nr:GntG family PLP-dependent aldolase [Glycomyces sp. TRM65418]MCC3765434.1 aminotransferase class I/II-fold pyridoxal phosphate-dependent enzyme [Glycomyces sp. TRM65418]QZD55044.1 aminotransferase class I/II-fold pyridoxal phosphate-dependent enzyme [Glycomyces sp. TRM65418]